MALRVARRSGSVHAQHAALYDQARCRGSWALPAQASGTRTSSRSTTAVSLRRPPQSVDGLVRTSFPEAAGLGQWRRNSPVVPQTPAGRSSLHPDGVRQRCSRLRADGEHGGRGIPIPSAHTGQQCVRCVRAHRCARERTRAVQRPLCLAACADSVSVQSYFHQPRRSKRRLKKNDELLRQQPGKLR